MTKVQRFLERLRPWMPYLNIVLATLAYLANEYWIQGFCQPVAWAGWVVLVSTGAFLLWPWAKKMPGLNHLLAFLMGVHFTVCVYCALFINPVQMVMMLVLAFLVFPLLLWVPIVFAVQAVNRVIVSKSVGLRAAFVIGVCALLPVQWWAELQYREIEAAVAQLPSPQRHQAAALLKVVPRTYMAERLAGAFFKYHNYEEMVLDGWRPPLHDPLVNISLWQRRGTYANPLIVDGLSCKKANGLECQALFYHHLFPALPIKADCACNHTYDGEGYFFWETQWNNLAASRRVQEELAKQEMMKKSKGTFRTHFPQGDSAAQLE